ncbi:MAG: response regulator [Candidatus Sulfotelmatobacter sp.]
MGTQGLTAYTPLILNLEQRYEVLTAANAVEGLHALSKSLPDLIVSDLNMPRMSGFEFLAVVREVSARRHDCHERRV